MQPGKALTPSYDAVGLPYDERIVPRFMPIADRLVAWTEIRPADRVVEVGAGTGALSRRILRHLGEAGSLSVTDLSAGMLAVAERALAEVEEGPDGRPRVEFVAADLRQLPFPGASADLLMGQMTPLLDNEEGLAEAFRILAPGGRLAVATWGQRYEETGLLNEARAAIGVAPYPVVDLRAFGPRLRRVGFVDVRQRTRPMTAHHASLDAYLAYRAAFGRISEDDAIVRRYFEVLRAAVQRSHPGGGPVALGWSITLVAARRADPARDVPA